MTVNDLANALKKIKDDDRDKPLIVATVDAVTYDDVTGVDEPGEDNVVLFTARYPKPGA